MRKKQMGKIFLFLTIFILSVVFIRQNVSAGETAFPGFSFTVSETENPEEVVSSLQMLLMIALITIAPTAILMVTSFSRYIISFHFVRTALGTQQMPPNQILIALALFLTIFTMAPVFSEVNEKAIQPYSSGAISQEAAIDEFVKPFKIFMAGETTVDDAALFIGLMQEPIQVETVQDLPLHVLIPAFILSEITKAFIFGFAICIPFIIIDMVVASVLMAMGMMMLPPAMISMPFKLLLFILIDGWNLVVTHLVGSFF